METIGGKPGGAARGEIGVGAKFDEYPESVGEGTMSE
jgi:hypothetical protein